jgi:hypothetical protein
MAAPEEALAVTTDEADSQPDVREMDIPKHTGEVIVCAIVYAIVVTFVILGVRNLCQWRWTRGITLGASILWLALVTSVVGMFVWEEGGPWQYLLNRVALFFGSNIAQTRQVDGVSTLRFGNRILGLPRFYLEVAIDGIDHVAWHWGQGSCMAYEDRDDWDVVVWFDVDAVQMSKARLRPYKAQEHHSIGPSGRRAEAEALGLQFIAFLRRAGATLIATEDSTKFVRPGNDI